MRSSKQRCLRKTLAYSDEDTDNDTLDSVQGDVPDPSQVAASIIELQRLRKRPRGLSLEALNSGKPLPAETKITSDPFKLATGGLVNMRMVDVHPEEEDDVEARLAKTFASETNKRDEDAEMLKYIDEELARRKGIVKELPEQKKDEADILHDVPAILKPKFGEQKEDMLSNQMLCGIPEVDLGVEAKMRNIEFTEEAKQKLLKERFHRRLGARTDGMAPTNISVNFVQHSRWNNYPTTYPRRVNETVVDVTNTSSEVPKVSKAIKSVPPVEPAQFDAERQRLQTEKATDSLVLQRFKNYMRDRRRR